MKFVSLTSLTFDCRLWYLGELEHSLRPCWALFWNSRENIWDFLYEISSFLGRKVSIAFHLMALLCRKAIEVLNRFHVWFFFIFAAPAEAQGHSSLNVYCAQLFFVSVLPKFNLYDVLCYICFLPYSDWGPCGWRLNRQTWLILNSAAATWAHSTIKSRNMKSVWITVSVFLIKILDYPLYSVWLLPVPESCFVPSHSVCLLQYNSNPLIPLDC